MKFSIDIYGDKQISREILRKAERVKDARPLWENLFELLEKRIRLNFQREGRYAGPGWAQLSPRYKKWKDKHYPGKKIMQRSGDLMRSLTSRNDANAIRQSKRKEMRFGTKLKYGAPHQRPKASNSLPERKPVEFTEATRREVVKRVQRFIFTGELVG